MSVLLRGSRPKRRVPRPSVREVCLLGVSRTPEAWAPGDRLLWSGRAYRVEETQVRAEGAGGAPRYVHLSSLGEA